MGSWSIWHWLVVLVVVALIFGTKKLRNVGEDLGSAIKSFRKGMQDGDAQAQLKADPPAPGQNGPNPTAPGETKSERADYPERAVFEVGLDKIALIAVVALLVLGPERLPGVARTLGALVRRARASWQNVKTEIERELAAEDVKRHLDDARRAASEMQGDVRSAAADIEKNARPTDPSSHGGA